MNRFVKLKKNHGSNSINVFLLIFQSGPLFVVAYLFINLLSALLPSALVVVSTEFINSVIAITKTKNGYDSTILYTVLLFLGYLYSRESEIIINLIRVKIICNLRDKISPAIVNKKTMLEYELLEDSEVLNLIERVTNKSEIQLFGLLQNSVSILCTLVKLGSLLTILIVQNYFLAVLFGIMTIPMLLISIRSGKKIYEMERKVSSLTRYMEYLSDILSNRESAEERSLFGFSPWINEEYKEVQKDRTNMNTSVLAREQMKIKFQSLILYITLFIVIIVLTIDVSENNLSIGLYISIVGALLNMIQTMVGDISNIFINISKNKQYCLDFESFLNLPQITKQKNMRKDIDFQTLEFRNVSFKYRNNKEYALKNICITFEKGKSYSIVGKNGSGKTTLVKLLTGVYSQYEGKILLNGVELREYDISELAKVFAIVYQDFARYNISLEDNISLGEKSIDAMQAAIQNAKLEDIISRLPEGCKTLLGKLEDKGIDVSGGEWHKIAIARALYRDSEFIILDEPTANLSPIAESELYYQFSNIVKEKTSVIISHRLGSTKLAHEIIVLDNGELIEHGTHEELIEKKGLYSEMYLSQGSWYYENGK